MKLDVLVCFGFLDRPCRPDVLLGVPQLLVEQ